MLHQHDCSNDNCYSGEGERAAAHKLSDSLGPLPSVRLTIHCVQYSEHSHRLGDILDPLGADIGITQWQLVFDVVMDRMGDADAAGLRQALYARCDVDAIA